MANYVWNKVLCDKDTLERYFIDYKPFGEEEVFSEPYITFNKLFDIKSLMEYREKIGAHIYYGLGCSYKQIDDGRYEIMFCTEWEYPIEAIKKVIMLSCSTEWYAVEENYSYISKFYWDDEVKEKFMLIEDGYDEWLDANREFSDSLEPPDCDVWYYLQIAKEEWHEWEGNDK